MNDKVSNINFYLITIIVLGLSVEALLWLNTFVPLYAAANSYVRPEKEIWFFWAFVSMAIIGEITAFILLKERLLEERLTKMLKACACAQLICVAILLCASWKMVIYDYRSDLVRHIWPWLLAVSLLVKIFWFKLRGFIQQTYAACCKPEAGDLPKRAADAFFLVLIVLLINIPDPQAVLAKMFVGEQYHHFDNVIMGPGWISVSGNLIYVDNVSQYGLGMPVIVGHLAKMLGGYSYLHVFVTIMWICITYYLLFYVLLRYWTKSILISMAAILTAIKIQMFFSFSYPMTFTYPNGSVLRSCFDIFFMASILAHIRTHRPVFLLAAGAVVGLCIFHIFTTGADLFLALCAYLGMHYLSPSYRRYIFTGFKDIPINLMYVGFPVAVAMLLIWLTVGANIVTHEFWHNVIDFPKLFALGLFKTEYFRGLIGANFWDVFMGAVFPAVYVLSLLYVGVQFYLGRGRYQDIFVLVLSVYGLSMYHHYAAMAVGNNYYMRAIPFVFIVYHWVNEFLKSVPASRQLPSKIVLVVFAAFCLVTNHNFIAHPNVFNFSRNPVTDPLVARGLPDGRTYYNHKFNAVAEDFKLEANSFGLKDERLIYNREYFANDEQIKRYWEKEFDFAKDVALIDRLTKPREKVALLSSFEIKILMQANRPPYFYFFPLLESRPMYMRTFAHTNMFIKSHVQKTLDQLAQHPPDYIFVERIYLNRVVPQRYALDLEEFIPVLAYIQAHYQPVEEGYFLVAMKKKN